MALDAATGKGLFTIYCGERVRVTYREPVEMDFDAPGTPPNAPEPHKHIRVNVKQVEGVVDYSPREPLPGTARRAVLLDASLTCWDEDEKREFRGTVDKCPLAYRPCNSWERVSERG